jgi:hypothetical protein
VFGHERPERLSFPRNQWLDNDLPVRSQAPHPINRWGNAWRFHPVGYIAAVMDADWTTVWLVDAESKREIASLRGTDDSQLHCVTFSPDGPFLGQTEAARRAMTKALKWRAEASGRTPSQIAEFQALVPEARALLSASLPALPHNVFDH